MAERFINLRDWHVRALLSGASSLLLPMKLYRHNDEDRAGTVRWEGDTLVQYGAGGVWVPVRAPFSPGDVLVGREAWDFVHPCQIAEGRYSRDSQYGFIPGPPRIDYRVIYRSEGPYPPTHHVQEFPWRVACSDKTCLKTHYPCGWISSAQMPSWAARWRLPAVACRAVDTHGLRRDELAIYRESYPNARYAWLVEVQR